VTVPTSRMNTVGFVPKRIGTLARSWMFRTVEFNGTIG
jgi:hypothetical protein